MGMYDDLAPRGGASRMRRVLLAIAGVASHLLSAGLVSSALLAAVAAA